MALRQDWGFIMRYSWLAAVWVAASATVSVAAPVPCEDSLKELRAALTDAKLADADMKAVKILEDKGIERCNADDDKRADGFFADAMKILGKK
jgi:hypothetical protein